MVSLCSSVVGGSPERFPPLRAGGAKRCPLSLWVSAGLDAEFMAPSNGLLCKMSVLPVGCHS